MRLVVDASVAVKWLVDEDGSRAADGILEHATELHAPRLLASEVANALWRKARLREIERGDAGVLAASVAQMPVSWTEDERICGEATRLAVGLDRPVYDCMYLALAHRVDARLVTADERFANALATTEHGGAIVTLAALEGEFETG
ncbi:MAG: type II toxin-antitoxin system VapC family toxin [Chloroflexota bacterium]|nr:type II toxin-antitoxin system VapC family toxin [Chloroflexota bacterium]